MPAKGSERHVNEADIQVVGQFEILPKQRPERPLFNPFLPLHLQSPQIGQQHVSATVASIRKNAREQVHVKLSEFSPEAGKVFNMVAARLHYDDGSGQHRPGKNGLNVQVKLLPKLVTALQQAEAEARAAGLLLDEADEARAAETTILGAD